jgi:acyl transferase domain-containing protein
MAQEMLIRDCYSRAGLDPKDTPYVEAHGTGTQAGDKIELNALGSVLGQSRDASNPLYVSSIKANLGHLESTSGLASLVKLVLMFEKRTIPPQALFEVPNPGVDFQRLNIKVFTH